MARKVLVALAIPWEYRWAPAGAPPSKGHSRMSHYLRVAVLVSALAVPVATAAQTSGGSVSPADRAGIEQLLSHYNQALQSCSSKEYADLFAADGTFSSDDFRGKTHHELYGKSATLTGHDKLVQLVETEEFCLNAEQRAKRATARPRAMSFANLTLEPRTDGIHGVLPLGNGGGRYEDVYVKTSDGWKFKSRNVVMPPLSPPSK